MQLHFFSPHAEGGREVNIYQHIISHVNAWMKADTGEVVEVVQGKLSECLAESSMDSRRLKNAALYANQCHLLFFPRRFEKLQKYVY